MRAPYPELQPHTTGFLRTADGDHELYYEVSGNPQGKPALFLHGGPGDGSSPKHRRLFDPATYKIVTFDQRGAGKSQPVGSIKSNSTADLVEDIEHLRKQLNISSWALVVGGSWGSTLALAYSQAHPGDVQAMVLYSIFLPSRDTIDWLYSPGGANGFYPDAYDKFISHLPISERASPAEAYYRRLQSPEDAIRLPAASRLGAWALTCLALTPDVDWIESVVSKPEALGTGSLIEMHYMVNMCFLEEDALLRDCTRIGHIPCKILHGRYDMMCQPVNAWRLHQVLPLSTLHFAPESGHSSTAAPRLKSAVIEAIDSFR